MPERRDKPIFLLTLVYSLWLMSFVYSFVSFFATGPTEDGANQAMARVMGFLGWQGIALVAAVAVWALGRGWSRRSGVRRMSLLPIVLSFLLAAALFAIVLWVGPA